MKCAKTIRVYGNSPQLAKDIYMASKMLEQLEVTYGLREPEKKKSDDYLAIDDNGLQLVRI